MADLLETIVAATRHTTEARERARRRSSTLRRAGQRQPQGQTFRDALARVAGAASHRRVQAPVAIERHPAQGLRSRRARRRICGRRSGGDFGPHRADVLRRQPRSPRAGSCGGHVSRSCARTSSSPKYQLVEAVAYGADAVLLIVGALDDRRASHAARLRAARASGSPTLVEVHDLAELERAVDAGADIIGVNSRNLRTLDRRSWRARRARPRRSRPA